MVLLKQKPSSLQDRQAVLSISLSTSSPTLSLSESAEAPFKLILTVRIVPGTSRQPNRAITIATTGTVLEPSNLPDTIDIISQGAIGPIRRINPSTPGDPSSQTSISLGELRPHVARRNNPPQDMRQRDWLHWLTIPADGAVQITHDMPLRRIFQHEHRLSKDDVVLEEPYRVDLNPGFVGTTWWCWGDLEGDLRDKKFSQWQKGWDGINVGVEKPGEEEEEKEDWVLGEDGTELWVEGSDEEAVFRFVK